MVEYIQSIKVTVEIDTNKTTYRETFEHIEDAKKYYENIVESIIHP